MKRTCWVFLGGIGLQLGLAAGVVHAQEPAIRFEQGLTWKDVQARAQREHKFIFLAWRTPRHCPPCEESLRQIFAQREVGESFNTKFISVSVPMDSALQGDTTVAGSWSAVARDLLQQHKLPGLPMLLFFSAEGLAVHKAPGWADTQGVLAAAVDALDPQRQYCTLLSAYRQGEREVAAMLYLARAARAMGDVEIAAPVARDAIRRAPERELLAEENIPVVAQFTTRSSDRGFAVFRRHAARINQVMDSAGYAERTVDAIIAKEEVAPRAEVTEPLPDWDAITKAVARKYTSAEAERVVAAAKAQRWTDLQQLYAPKPSIFALNNLAWGIFERSSDPEQLEAAIAWMKRALDEEKGPVHTAIIDTYANLLYKVGRVDEAITWQEKALAAEPDPSGRDGLRKTLEKMKRGEPTWPQ